MFGVLALLLVVSPPHFGAARGWHVGSRPAPPAPPSACAGERRAADGPLVRGTPEPLRLGAALLLLAAAPSSGGGGLGGGALSRYAQRFPQRGAEPLDCELAIARLTPLVLRDRSQNRAGARDHAPLLRVRQRVRGLDVEDGDDPRLGLLRVLAAGPARAGDLQLDFGQRQHDRTRDANRLGGHGRDSARRGRRPARLRPAVA